MFATLGPLAFELLDAPTDMERVRAWEFPEHARIGGAPRLQYTARNLETIRLECRWDISFCEPQAQVDALTAMGDGHAPHLFALGTGRVLGNFVIVEFTVRSTATTQRGGLLHATATITLKEVAEDVARAASEESATKRQAAPARRPAGTASPVTTKTALKRG